MSKTKNYCQCTIVKNYPNGQKMTTVSFIPEEFAVEGNMLRLKNDAGEWVDGWLVTEVGRAWPAAEVELQERDYLKNRKASDI